MKVNTAAMNDNEPVTRQANRLWPLYAVGLALMAFGFYFAFFESAPPKPTASAKIAVVGTGTDSVPKDLDRSASVMLAVKPMSRKSKVLLQQSQSSKDNKTVETELRVVMQDTPAGGLSFERSYPDVEIQIRGGEGSLDGDIPAHVADLLMTVRHHVELDPNGQIKAYELTSSQSGQLGPLLAMMKDAMQMLSPQFPREAVNVDEPWSYRAPYELRSEDGSVTVQGDYQVSSTFRGVQVVDGRRLAVVEQNLSGNGKGKFKNGDATASFSNTGVGHAVFFFDMEAGQVVRSGVVFEQVSSLGKAPGVQSTTRLSLEPAL